MTDVRTEAIPLIDGSTLRLTVAEPVGSIRGGIVVLHEARGVTDAVRNLVHGLAGEGWLAVAPHLYHREGADELDGDDGQVQQRVDRLDGEQMMADTDTAFDWLSEHDIGTDRMGVIGFDLGGTVALLVATERTLGRCGDGGGRGHRRGPVRGAAVPGRRRPGSDLSVAGDLRRAGRRRAPGAQAAAGRRASSSEVATNVVVYPAQRAPLRRRSGRGRRRLAAHPQLVRLAPALSPRPRGW